MDIEDYFNHLENKYSYHFFFSEIKNTKEADLAILIELMRAAHHIQDIHKLLTLLGSFDEITFVSQYNSTFTLTCTISASQFREALKLFGKLIKTDFYKSIENILSKNEKDTVNTLVFIVQEYEAKQGFLIEILKPLRDETFHYLNDLNKMVSYIHDIKQNELNKEEDYHTIDIETAFFEPGIAYDQTIYNDYLALGKDMRPLQGQAKVWELQEIFIEVTKIMIGHLMKKENIEKRLQKEMMLSDYYPKEEEY